MCVLGRILPRPVRLQDFRDMVFRKLVLVLAVLILAAGVDEQDVSIRPIAPEDQNRRRNGRPAEELFGEADNSIEQVFINELFADFSFAGAPKENTVRHDHAHASGFWLQNLYHMKDESVVALGWRREAATKASELVVCCAIVAPLF